MSTIKSFLLIASALTSVISPLLVQAGEPVETRIVNYAGIDLSADKGAAMLYARLKSAADAVCRNFESKQLSQLAAHEACLRQALDGAVRQVDSVKLSQLYWATKNRKAETVHWAAR